MSPNIPVLLSDDPTALTLYRAYVDFYTEESHPHARALGYAQIDFHAAHALTRTKAERRAAERRIRGMAWQTTQAPPTRIRNRDG